MDFHRKSRSIGRRSSILKIDKDDDTACTIVFNNKGRSKPSRRVSFAETYQVKEFPRDSPQHHVVWKQETTEDGLPVSSEIVPAPSKVNHEIIGLDKLLTEPIQADPYQNAADSFMQDVGMSNLLSGDRTILGPLDMDTTATLGNIELPTMTFDTEPSAEFKIDGSALLRSMMGKPSDRLKTMQIYSPNREPLSFAKEDIENMDTSFTLRGSERSPMKTLLAQDDGDNFVIDTEPPPVKSFHLFGDPPVQSQSLLNANSNNSYGKKLALGENGEIKFMNNENENPYTFQEPGTVSMQFDVNPFSQSLETTRYFDNTNHKMGLEETMCIGGIVQETENVNLACQANNSAGIAPVTSIQVNTDSGNGMDETECIGCIKNNGPQNLNLTTQALSATNNDETNHTGKVINKTLDVTNPVSDYRPSRRSSSESSAEMEETRCIGGIVDKTLHTTNQMSGLFTQNSAAQPMENTRMEETQCLGGILDKTSNASNLKSPFRIGNTTHSIQDVCMDETKCIGGILDKTSNTTSLKSSPINGNITQTMQDAGMEETKCIGGILDKTSNTTSLKSSAINGNITQTMQDDGMDETKCIGGILNRTVNTTTLKSSPINDTCNITQIMQDAGMEETKCIGGILDKTSTATHLKSLLGSSSFPHVLKLGYKTNKNETSSTDCTGMEETKCIGGILDKSVNVTKTMEFSNSSNVTSSVDVVGMDETKCRGGILENSTVEVSSGNINTDKHLNKTLNTTLCMDETKCLGGGITANGTNSEMKREQFSISDDTQSMAETRCIGGIVNMDETAVTHMKQSDNSHNNSILEKTKCFDMTGTWSTTNLKAVYYKQRLSSDNKDQTADMTGSLETKYQFDLRTVGGVGIVGSENDERDQSSVSMMQETKCVDGLLDVEKTSNLSMNKIENMVEAVSKNVGSLLAENDKSEVNKTVNKTMVFEETTCLGGIIKDSVTGNTTRHDTMVMNETNCLGGILSTGSQNKLNVSGCELIEDSDELQRRTDQTNPISVEREKSQFSNWVSPVQQSTPSSDLEYKMVDDEVTFVTKKSSKRTHYIDDVVTREKTTDFTMSQTKYQRLKDMLILSKGKTAAHLKTADSKTHSNSQSNVSKDLGLSFQDTCPASKKMKLSASPVKAEEVGEHVLDTVESASERIRHCEKNKEHVVNLSLQATLVDGGIHDELMPDEMNTGPLSNPDLGSLTHTGHLSDLANVTQGSNTTTAHDVLSNSDVANITRSSNSAENNQSMSLCHSKLLQSFIIPSGPMTMETFVKAMYLSKIKTVNTRCSLLMLPKVDLEDRLEVMLAELTLGAAVEAKKDLCDLVMERIRKEHETVEWLHGTLEETQPQIFQDCANLEGAEFESLQKTVFDLSASCSRQAQTEWRKLTRTHLDHTLHAVKTNGKTKAEDLLKEVQSKLQKVDDFMASLNDDMLEMGRNDVLLTELDKTEGTLASDLEELEEAMEDGVEEEERLASTLQQQRNGQNMLDSLHNTKEKIKVYLMCLSWDLDELSESHITFTFLDKLLVVTVNFCPAGPDIQILDISVRSLLNADRCPRYRCFAHALAVAGIESMLSQQKYRTLADLKNDVAWYGEIVAHVLFQLLTRVSANIQEIIQLCEDLKPVNCRRKFWFEQNRLTMEFWSLQTLDEISVSLTFNPCTPLSARADVHVHVIMGNVSGDNVKARLDGVDPGERYASRLLDMARLDQT